jgi:hypothetical protein
MATPLRHRAVILAAYLIGGGGVTCAAYAAQPAEAQIAVIVSNQDSLASINGELLHEVYLKRVSITPDGRRYVPVNLPAVHRLRNAFSASVLHMDAQHQQIYWDRRYFQGLSPPYVLGSQAAVVKFVAMTPGAIGYIQRCFVTPAVHVVLMMPLPDSVAAGTLEKCPEAGAP